MLVNHPLPTARYWSGKSWAGAYIPTPSPSERRMRPFLSIEDQERLVQMGYNSLDDDSDYDDVE